MHSQLSVIVWQEFRKSHRCNSFCMRLFVSCIASRSLIPLSYRLSVYSTTKIQIERGWLSKEWYVNRVSWPGNNDKENFFASNRSLMFSEISMSFLLFYRVLRQHCSLHWKKTNPIDLPIVSLHICSQWRILVWWEHPNVTGVVRTVRFPP